MTIHFSSGPSKNSEKQKKTANVSVDKGADSIDKVVTKPVEHLDTAAKTAQPRPGLLKHQETGYDSRLENTIRPKTLREYVGQQLLKDSIQISLDAAKNRKEALDHLLFYGPPGLGKTTLAMVIAQEMGAEIHITSAPALERPRDILGILMGMKPGGVLFIDEIHRLNKVTEEILYPAMEDYALDRTIGKGEATKILRVPLPRFTLVGATTKAGSLSGPLRDRFGMVYRLNFYTEDELMAIVCRSAKILNIDVTPEGSRAIARRSRGTPRIANRLLRRVRDFLEVRRENQKHIDGPVAEEALDLFEIDMVGLDTTDRALLRLIIENFSGGPVGLETLASSLGEDARTIEDVYEPYLLQAGLINRTPRGRVVTMAAYRHLGFTVPSSALATSRPSDWMEQTRLELD